MEHHTKGFRFLRVNLSAIDNSVTAVNNHNIGVVFVFIQHI